jgi:hypothetical protein
MIMPKDSFKVFVNCLLMIYFLIKFSPLINNSLLVCRSILFLFHHRIFLFMKYKIFFISFFIVLSMATERFFFKMKFIIDLICVRNSLGHHIQKWFPHININKNKL